MIKVLGLGDNVVDKYMHIKTMYPGGNALNIAVLARLSGIEVGYLGVFGDDEAAKHVYKTVSDMGIDVSHCRFYHGENGYAEVRLDDGDRVFIGSNQGGVSKEHPIDSFTDIELDYIAEYDVCHTSIFSYVEESLPEIRKASGCAGILQRQACSCDLHRTVFYRGSTCSVLCMAVSLRCTGYPG